MRVRGGGREGEEKSKAVEQPRLRTGARCRDAFCPFSPFIKMIAPFHRGINYSPGNRYNINIHSHSHSHTTNYCRRSFLYRFTSVFASVTTCKQSTLLAWTSSPALSPSPVHATFLVLSLPSAAACGVPGHASGRWFQLPFVGHLRYQFRDRQTTY